MNTGPFICLALILVGCAASVPESENRVVRVYEAELSAAEISDHVPDGLEVDDSIVVANQYIDQWIREQVLVHQAEQSLALEEDEFQRELATYRNALLMHEFKERYIQERLNLAVSEEELQAFYEEQADSFYLTDYYVRALFIHAPEMDESRLKPIRTMFAELDSSRIIDMERWCVENAATYSLDADLWWPLNDFTQEVPLQLYRAEKLLAQRKIIEFTDGGRIYFVQILEHALKDKIAPLSVVSEQVKEMILHQRRQQLLLNMEERLIMKAYAEGAVERTENDE